MNFYSPVFIPIADNNNMGRIIGIDYGKVRTGLAVTDPLQLIVNGLDTIPTNELETFLQQYFSKEKVEKVVIGQPRHKDGNLTSLWPAIQKLEAFIKKNFADIEVDFEDESYTSSEAKQILLVTTKKKKRRDKKIIDKVSAVLILQKYLGHL